MVKRDRAYAARVAAQTFEWARGRPYHNRIDDECCPDFSCCAPHLFEPDETKRWHIRLFWYLRCVSGEKPWRLANDH